MRRGQTVDSAYLDTLYSDVISLYRLDQLSTGGAATAGKADLGPLPPTAVALLAALAVAWALIALYAVITAVKKKSSLKKGDAH